MDAHVPREVPPCPAEALDWLVGAGDLRVLVLGDDRLGPVLAERGHEVVREPAQPPRSVDVVLATHTAPDDLAEVAGLLRPGGHLALLVSDRDHRIPWARKLDRVIGAEVTEDPARPVVDSRYFGWVDEQVHRSMDPVNHFTLPDLLRRWPALADLPTEEQEDRIAAALELYDEYGRGADGMQLPLVHRCFRATVVPDAVPAPPRSPETEDEDRTDHDRTDDREGAGRADTDRSGGPATEPVEGGQIFTAEDFDDTGMLLIDFR